MKERKRGRLGSLWRFLEFFMDMAIIILALYAAILLDEIISGTGVLEQTLDTRQSFPSNLLDPNNWIPLIMYLLVTAMFFKLYHTSVVGRRYRTIMQNVALALIFTNVFLIVIAFIRGDNFILRNPISTIFVIFIQFLIFTVYKFAVHKIYTKVNNNYILIIGPKEEVDVFGREFFLSKHHYYKLKYLVYTDDVKDLNNDLYAVIDSVDSVFVCEGISHKLKENILDYVSFMTFKKVSVVPKKDQILTLDAKFDQIEDIMLLQIKDMHMSVEMRFIKRTIDLIVSSVTLIIALIPMLIVALIIKLQDRGPVFYKQERFRRFNKPFYILKFRSMTVNQTYEDEQRQATKNDPRITKFGRFIRATRIDELPQLINVFKGEMSLVGPRPYMKSDVDKAMSENPDFQFRANVKPGITGLSHIYGRHDTSSKDRLRYDLYYIRRNSIWLDLKIIVLTILTIFNKEAGLGRGEIVVSLDEMIYGRGLEIIPLKCGNIKGFEVLNKLEKLEYEEKIKDKS